MLAYLENLLPRLRRFSNELDNTTLLVDQPWVVIDEAGQRSVYVFRASKELLVSTEGNVSTAVWDYIAPMRALLIDQKGQKTLYKSAFFNEAVLVLQKDGTTADYWLLTNENKIAQHDLLQIATQLERTYLGEAKPDQAPSFASTAALPQTNSIKTPWIGGILLILGVIVLIANSGHDEGSSLAGAIMMGAGIIATVLEMAFSE